MVSFMKKRHWIIVPVILLILLIIVGSIIYLDSIKKKERSPEFIFTYAENQSESYPTSQGAKYFAQLVEERTGGRIKILVYTGGELGREADIITQMRYGGVDFARISLSQLAVVDDKLNVLQMPYLYDNAEHMWSVLDGEIGNSFLKEIGRYDLVGLSWYDAGCRNFYTTTSVNTLEDMQGLTIRVQQSDLMIDMVNSLGATAAPLSYEEVYSALQLGTIDGAENNWPSYEDTGHCDVAKYLLEDEHTRVPEMQLCSANTWKLLSEADKDIIKECALESAIYERDLWAEREDSSKESAIRTGVVVSQLPPEEKERFRELMAPVYEKYCSEYMDLLNEIIRKEEEPE